MIATATRADGQWYPADPQFLPETCIDHLKTDDPDGIPAGLRGGQQRSDGRIPHRMVVEGAFGLDTARHLSLKGRYLRWMESRTGAGSWWPIRGDSRHWLIRRHRPKRSSRPSPSPPPDDRLTPAQTFRPAARPRLPATPWARLPVNRPPGRSAGASDQAHRRRAVISRPDATRAMYRALSRKPAVAGR